MTFWWSTLRETISTLTAQVIVLRDETWLSQQAATELANLHGVQFDRALRLLEAIEPANQRDAGEIKR